LKKNNLQSDAILRFLREIHPNFQLPDGIFCMVPQSNAETWQLMQTFYHKYYGDWQSRILIFGINPGRYGGGLTGIPFTDPIRLERVCGIQNPFRKIPELSSEFIYKVIERFGGPDDFYGRFFFSSLSPVGFTKDGKNLNYYDDKKLLHTIGPFIENSIEKQKFMLSVTDRCFCLGEGENFRYFSALNTKKKYFSQIQPLPHPRWIMQYRRKKLDEYISLFVDKLSAAAHQ
jgi:uracil DNA glycosylase superfamily protein